MSPAPVVAACVQMRSGRDPAVNRDDAVALIRQAADAGATYVQTPEMTGLVERSRRSLMENIRSEADDPLIAAVRDVARARGLMVHIGSLALKDGDKVANRAFVVDAAGDIVATYTKIHLFDVDLPGGESWRESATYVGGAEAPVVASPIGALGVTICYDLRFPYLYRALAAAGAAVLTAPACFTRQTGEAHWHVLQRARAIENGAFILSAAQGGLHADGRETYGHSLIVDPWGRVLAEGGTEPGVILAEIDPAAVAEARQRIPSLQHTRPVKVRHAGTVMSEVAEA
ncbi:carbon-nitrogen hydrolase family protein [Chelatococcus reniformis]|uniref:Amidohydrolase n=1 Tax=Chelatococcus reniformis TaxID=1494448 RepID=A0A916TY60_9HYPH|nr:carbon-nitrogen hydrolase family protein [Chelatococcus reniformis]GGC50316.1 amidohydrolase [Chelatococcus reniformis]